MKKARLAINKFRLHIALAVVTAATAILTMQAVTGLAATNTATWTPAGTDAFGFATHMAQDNSGNIFISDWNKHRISKLSPSGTVLAQYGSQGSAAGQFDGPLGLNFDQFGNLWVAEEFNDRIQKCTLSPFSCTTFGSMGSGNGQFQNPTDITFDNAGYFWVSDAQNHRLQKFNNSGVYQEQYGSLGTGNGQFDNPSSLAFDQLNNLMYVLDLNNNNVQKFDMTSGSPVFMTKWGTFGAGSGQFSTPFDLTIDPFGNVIVADSGNHRIQQFSNTGSIIQSFGTAGSGPGQMTRPSGVVANSSYIYVSDTSNQRLQVWTNGTPITSDLELIIAGSIVPVVNTQTSYTTTLTNQGPDTATNIQVSANIPAGYNFLSYTSSVGTYLPGPSATWFIPSLAPNSSAYLTFNVEVLPTGDHTFYSEVTLSSSYDPDSTPGNNSTTEDDDFIRTVTPTPRIDLSLTKIANKTSAYANDPVTFTLTVSNEAGWSTATGVTVKDILPNGYTYVSSNGTGTYNNSTGIWTIGQNIPAGTSVSLNIVTSMNGSGTGFGNFAEIFSANETDLDSTPNNILDEDDLDFVSVTLLQPINLSLVKTVDSGPAPYYVGEPITFALTLSNIGAGNASGIVVEDVLPSGFTYVSSDAGSTYDNLTKKITWNVGAMGAGGSTALHIQATINTSGNYANTALATATQQDSDPNNNNSTLTISPLPSANLHLTKTVNNATPYVGDTVTFTVTVTNNGPSVANNVQVTDLLNNGYTLVNSNVGAAYVPATGIWTIPSLSATAPGNTATLILGATVKATGVYTNSAEITAGPYDKDITDNDDLVNVNPVASANLSITKTIDNPTPNIGTNVVFMLTATNLGPSNATNVVVNDLLPNGYTYISDSGTGTYVPGTGVWTIPTLTTTAPNNTKTLQIGATVKATGTYNNTANISATTYDPINANNTSTVNVTPPATADLSLTKAVSNTSPHVGENVTFTLTVNNAGPDNATGIMVKDLLPSGYLYVSDNGVGAYSSGTGNWNVGNVANGASKSLQIIATVQDSGNYGNQTQITASNQFDPDSTPNNFPAFDEDDDAVVVVAAIPSADLSVTKTVNNPTPNVGANVIFTLTAANAGPSYAPNVTVTDTLPNGYTYVNNDGGATFASPTLTWNAGGIAKGASKTLHVTATVNASGTYLNSAQVSSPTFDADNANNSTTANVTPVYVNTSDLSITKTVNNPTPNDGEQIVFTLTISNSGPDAATNIIVTDFLPNGFDYESDDGALGEYNFVTGVWDVGSLTSGVSKTLHITVNVSAGGSHLNTATITSFNGNDANNANNTASVSVTDSTETILDTFTNDAESALCGSIDCLYAPDAQNDSINPVSGFRTEDWINVVGNYINDVVSLPIMDIPIGMNFECTQTASWTCQVDVIALYNPDAAPAPFSSVQISGPIEMPIDQFQNSALYTATGGKTFYLRAWPTMPVNQTVCVVDEWSPIVTTNPTNCVNNNAQGVHLLTCNGIQRTLGDNNFTNGTQSASSDPAFPQGPKERKYTCTKIQYPVTNIDPRTGLPVTDYYPMLKVEGLAYSHVFTFTDTDNDGVNDSFDMCPGLAGTAEFQGCDCAVSVRSKTNAPGQPSQNTASMVTLYDKATLNSCTGFTPADPATALACGHINQGSFNPLENPNGVVLGHACGKQLYVTAEANTKVSGHDVGNNDAAAPQPKKALVAFHINSAGETVGTRTSYKKGSTLWIAEPIYTYISGPTVYYPFSFTGEEIPEGTSWEVDVCTSAPEGYKLADDQPCLQTFVGNETKILEFELIEVGTKPPRNQHFSFNFKNPEGKKSTLESDVQNRMSREFCKAKGIICDDLGMNAGDEPENPAKNGKADVLGLSNDSIWAGLIGALLVGGLVYFVMSRKPNKKK